MVLVSRDEKRSDGVRKSIASCGEISLIGAVLVVTAILAYLSLLTSRERKHGSNYDFKEPI